MITKKVLELQKIASKNTIREEIQGVYINKNIAIATDSFKLAKITSKNYNVPEGSTDIDNILYLKDIKIPKNSENLFLKERKEKSLILSDGNNDVIVPKIEGSYPDINHLYEEIKEKKILSETLVSGKLLNDVSNFLKDQKEVKIIIRDNRTAIEFITEDENQKIEVLLMPIFSK